MDSNIKVEYKILRSDKEGWLGPVVDFDKFENELNRLGQEGWDAFASIDINRHEGSTKEIVLFLKKYITQD